MVVLNLRAYIKTDIIGKNFKIGAHQFQIKVRVNEFEGPLVSFVSLFLQCCWSSFQFFIHLHVVLTCKPKMSINIRQVHSAFYIILFDHMHFACVQRNNSYTNTIRLTRRDSQLFPKHDIGMFTAILEIKHLHSS